MKKAIFFLGVLIAVSGCLIERGDACGTDASWQTIGQITVPDSQCTATGAQCRQELVQIEWDSVKGVFDFVYIPTSCAACPAGTTPATCGQ
jgi:hypothetical protein